MKSLLTSLLLFLPFTLFAEDVIVSAKVSDRARNGAAIRGQFKYPVVELESGETASVHIGEVLRYPVWMETVEVDDGMTREETVYDETPIGLVLSVKVAAEGEVITYSGKASSIVADTVTENGASVGSKEVSFLGKVGNGEMITVTMTGPDGAAEEVVLHFALAE